MADWKEAVRAAQSKQAQELVVLDIRGVSSFTDTFILCSGSNARQMQAISGAIEDSLKQTGSRPIGVEGYETAHWILMDYGDFIVHIFSEEARGFYDLERLWKNAVRVPVPEAA